MKSELSYDGGMRRLHKDGYDTADALLTLLVRCGYWPDPETKILDYGCGEGSLVYRLRELRSDAYGFDIHERIKYRSPKDRRFFAFAENPERDTSNMVIKDELVRVTFPDNTFDLVISEAVIEHVMDLSLMMREIARVLKPSGVSLHTLPRSSMLIEPHNYMPLGIQFPKWWWFYLWALLGVRNGFQEGLSAREVADIDYNYSQTGVTYLPRAQVLEVCNRYFESVRFADREMYEGTTRRWRWGRRIRAFRSENRMRALSESTSFTALLTSGKRAEPLPGIGMRFQDRVRRYLARKIGLFTARGAVLRAPERSGP